MSSSENLNQTSLSPNTTILSPADGIPRLLATFILLQGKSTINADLLPPSTDGPRGFDVHITDSDMENGLSNFQNPLLWWPLFQKGIPTYEDTESNSYTTTLSQAPTCQCSAWHPPPNYEPHYEPLLPSPEALARKLGFQYGANFLSEREERVVRVYKPILSRVKRCCECGEAPRRVMLKGCTCGHGYCGICK
jgi:hypothetical protein